MRSLICLLTLTAALAADCVRIASLAADPVPAGIDNPADLGNARFPGVPPVRWADVEGRDLRDVLLWIDADNPSTEPLCVEFFTPKIYTPQIGNRLGGTIVRLFTQSGGEYLPSAALTYHQPSVTRVELAARFGWALRPKPYPGYAMRHPSEPSPVGAVWPEHSHNGKAAVPIIYYPSPADVADPKPQGFVHKQLNADGYVVRFRKYREVVGIFRWFGGGESRFYWRYEGHSIQEGE